MIKAVADKTPPYFGFDCVNLIKAILWGWTGDKSKSYGGSTYASNGVPDISADSMITVCKSVSNADWANMTPGEVVWMKGHIGIYVGNGLCVECSPAWKNKVQITAVGNIGAKSGYNSRTWTKHGLLPYVDYSDQAAAGKTSSNASTVSTSSAPSSKTYKLAAAKSFDKSLAGIYTTKGAYNMRYVPGDMADANVILVIPKGKKAHCYGYYTTVSGTKWLYVTYDGKAGFVSAEGLGK
jgi:hypothetical protein